MLTLLIGTLLIITLYTLLFIRAGSLLMRKLVSTNFSVKLHATFHLGANFIIGVIVFLSLWVVLTHLFGNAKVGLAISTSILLVGGALDYLKVSVVTYGRSTIIFSCLFTLLLITISIFKALTPMPEYFVSEPELVNPFLGSGSIAHSFRASNIIENITNTNSFPVLTQHTGQSIIASIPNFFGIKTPQLSLTIWVAIFISFLTLTTYGLTRYFTTSRYLALIPVLIVMLGNTVLSPFYSSITDTESALLLSSNVDSLFGIISFIVIGLLIYFSLTNTVSKALLILTFITGFIWNITSGQMIILFFLLVMFGLMTMRQLPYAIRNLKKVLLVFLLGSIIGAFTIGGMLSPIPSTDHLAIPGVMSLKQPDTSALTLRSPRTGESAPQTLSKMRLMLTPEDTKPEVTMPPTDGTKQADLASSVKQNGLLFAVAKVVRSFQLIFFPALGLLTMYLILKRRVYFQAELHKVINHIWWSTALLFVAGWAASTFFTVYGYYWELSKFFYNGVYLAMFMLGLSLVILFKQYAKLRTVLVAIVVFVVIGPTLELLAVRLLGNIYLPAASHPNFHTSQTDVNLEPLSLGERFEFLVSAQQIYGENLLPAAEGSAN